MFQTAPLQLLATTATQSEGKIDWTILGLVLVGTAVLMVGIKMVGNYLASTHPTPPPPPIIDEENEIEEELSPEILAVISSAIVIAVGGPVKISSVHTVVPPPGVESLMQQWALEGRRQIYTTRKVR